MNYYDETLSIAKKRSDELKQQFLYEVTHLLSSGMVDSENHSRGLLFGIAIERIADNYLRGERKSKEYKNLQSI